jgi:two-component system sporulation sensor kinase A
MCAQLPPERERILDAPETTSRKSEGAMQTAFNQVVHLAHEIKNSMTSISTFVQLLPSKWHDVRFRDAFYPVVSEEAQRITELINDMLDLGKKQSVQLASTNIEDLLDNLLALKAPLAEQRSLRLHTRIEVSLPTLRIDQEKIKEAIVNLLHNAMEATPDGGNIHIRVEDDRLPNGRPAVRLEIQDSGPGIDKALQAVIFDAFMSTKSEGQLPAGTGLGLHIAKRHIEAHGGTISVESPPGSGALFRVILPVERRRV